MSSFEILIVYSPVIVLFVGMLIAFGVRHYLDNTAA